MLRNSRAAILSVLLGTAASTGWAADTTLQEIRDLRALVEKQTKQIDALAEQVARLNHALQGKAAAGTENNIPVAAAVVPAPAQSAEFSPDTPKATAPEGKRHVVVKGETLTSIAKSYNIPLSDLQKSNKGIDERKLQIGQSLIIPATPTPDPSTDKKENP